MQKPDPDLKQQWDKLHHENEVKAANQKRGTLDTARQKKKEQALSTISERREANRLRKALKRDRRAAFMMGVSLAEYHTIAMYLHEQGKPGAQRGKYAR